MTWAAVQQPQPMSFEAFGAFLDARPGERWELIDGQPVAMANVTRRHSLIAGAIYAALRGPALGQGCEAHVSDFLASGGDFSGFLAVPDVFVRCGPGDDVARRADDPVVVVEVLSPSAIRHDRVVKFDRYTRIASMRQIILAYQDEVRVENFPRDDGDEWPMATYKRLDEAVPVPSLDTSLSISDLYAGTSLALPDPTGTA